MQQSSRTQETKRESPSGYVWFAIGAALLAAGFFLVTGPRAA